MKGIPPQLTQEFSSLIGIPYSKMDCYQLVAEFYRRLYGLNFLDYKYKTEDIKKEEIIEMIKTNKFSEEFAVVKNPSFGDLVVLSLAGYPIHIGIYLFDNKMLHTLRGKDSCIENLDFKWKNRIEGIYRWQKFKHIH